MNAIRLSPLQQPISRTIEVPGSKSITNRALIIAALSGHRVTIKNPLESGDTQAMADCLTVLGVHIRKKPSGWVIGGKIHGASIVRSLRARLSGTTMRFLLPLLCTVPGTIILTGESGLNARPIGVLVDALRNMGAHIAYLKKPGHPPVRITGSKLRAGHIRVSGQISSQFISALLMVLPTIEDATVHVTGRQVSAGYIRMTLRLMRACGVRAEVSGGNIHIRAASYRTQQITIEPDISSACYAAAIATLTKSCIIICGLTRTGMQPDAEFLSILQTMGTDIRDGKSGLTIRGTGVRPVSVDMVSCPDQIQTLAVLAAFARGKTVIRGIRTLRIKETDRVAAIQNNLARMGIRTRATGSALTIWGGNPVSAKISTCNDHRTAMSFAIAGTVLGHIIIKNPDVVSKTFPGFWQMLSTLGVGLERDI